MPHFYGPPQKKLLLVLLTLPQVTSRIAEAGVLGAAGTAGPVGRCRMHGYLSWVGGCTVSIPLSAAPNCNIATTHARTGDRSRRQQQQQPSPSLRGEEGKEPPPIPIPLTPPVPNCNNPSKPSPPSIYPLPTAGKRCTKKIFSMLYDAPLFENAACRHLKERL